VGGYRDEYGDPWKDRGVFFVFNHTLYLPLLVLYRVRMNEQ